MHLSAPHGPDGRRPRRGAVLAPRSWPCPGYAAAVHARDLPPQGPAASRILASGLGSTLGSTSVPTARSTSPTASAAGRPGGPGSGHTSAVHHGLPTRSPRARRRRWTSPSSDGRRTSWSASSAPTSAAPRRRHLPDRRPPRVHGRRRHRRLHARAPAGHGLLRAQRPAVRDAVLPGTASWSPTAITTASTGSASTARRRGRGVRRHRAHRHPVAGADRILHDRGRSGAAPAGDRSPRPARPGARAATPRSLATGTRLAVDRGPPRLGPLHPFSGRLPGRRGARVRRPTPTPER